MVVVVVVVWFWSLFVKGRGRLGEVMRHVYMVMGKAWVMSIGWYECWHHDEAIVNNKGITALRE